MKHPKPGALAAIIVILVGFLAFGFVSLLSVVLNWGFWLPATVAFLTFGLAQTAALLPRRFWESLAEKEDDADQE